MCDNISPAPLQETAPNGHVWGHKRQDRAVACLGSARLKYTHVANKNPIFNQMFNAWLVG